MIVLYAVSSLCVFLLLYQFFTRGGGQATQRHLAYEKKVGYKDFEMELKTCSKEIRPGRRVRFSSRVKCREFKV